MYNNTVTVFNRTGSEKKGYTWYPSVLSGVNIVVDKGANVAKTGLSDANKADLHIKYSGDYIGLKKYLPPKEWEKQSDEEKAKSITFNEGEDFFIRGDFSEDVIIEDGILFPKGFFDYAKKTFDDVFKITTVGRYEMIPHFEIGGE